MMNDKWIPIGLGLIVAVFLGLGALGVLSACNPEPTRRVNTDERGIDTWHDDQLNVTCWVLYSGNGISCLPDSAIGGTR